MKNRELEYQLILKLILPISLVVMIAIYFLALRPTVSVYCEYAANCGSGVSTEALSVSPGYTADRIRQVNAGYLRFSIDTLSWKNVLWNAASGLSKKYSATIVAYPPVRQETVDQQRTYRQRVGFRGDYPALMKLLHEAEGLKHMGVVSGIALIRKPREEQTVLNIDFVGFQRTK